MSSKKSVKQAIKDIQNYYLKFYNIQIDDSVHDDHGFLNALLQCVDTKSFEDGYESALRDRTNNEV